MSTTTVGSAQDSYIEAPDDIEAAYEFCEKNGFGDGLPVIPPTIERVERMLMFCDRPRDQPIMTVAPSYGDATPLRIAANAVMAGCRPEYLPIVMLALEAMGDDAYNLYGVQATTHPCTPLIIVNGPIARELQINSGFRAFGAGPRSNASIGRAVHLSLLNIGGAKPGAGDMATAGTPAKYSYCVAENEAESPWAPLSVEEGFPSDSTTVTVVAAEGPHNVNDHESTSAEGILKTIAGTVAITGSNNAHHESRPVIALCPEHAATIAGSGFSKSDVKKYLHENARIPLSKFSTENVDRRLRKKFPERYGNASLDTLVPMAKQPEDYIVIVVGGAGKHSAFIPTFGSHRPVTLALKRNDGQLARSIQEFRTAR
jgi:hypothetical protein